MAEKRPFRGDVVIYNRDREIRIPASIIEAHGIQFDAAAQRVTLTLFADGLRLSPSSD